MGSTILVVEDDRDFALQLASMLEFQGLEVATASTGPAALRIFQERRTDFVLVDVMLPSSHGLTVVDQLRALPGGADVPVILTSPVYGPTDVSTRDRARLGVLEYVTRPFSLLELGRRICALLAGPEGGRAAVRALQARSGAPGGGAGLELITDSMTAVPDFVAEALEDVTEDEIELPARGAAPFAAPGPDEGDGLVVEIEDGPEEDEGEPYDVDVEEDFEIDFETGSMAAIADEDLDPETTSSGFYLVAEPGEMRHPQPVTSGSWARAEEPEVPPVAPRTGPLDAFEIDVEMGRSGTFEALDDAEDEAPRGDPVVLVRLMTGQDALPHRVVSALVAAHLSQAAGRLRLATPSGHTDLLLLNGYPVWVETEPFADGLPAWLVHEGRVTGEEGAKIVNLHQKRAWAAPRILAALQRFRPEDVDELLQAWVTDHVAAAMTWTGRMTWLPGDAWASDVPIYEANPVRALWPAVLKNRLGRIELDVAHLEGKTLARTADALRVLDRLPATSSLSRLQAALAKPTAWSDLLPDDVDERDEALRLLWLLDAAGCLTEDEGQDAGVVAPRGQFDTLRIPLSVINAVSADASDAELRIQQDWLQKMQQGPFEFLELPDVIESRSVRAAYAALARRWRLSPEDSLVSPDTMRKGKELQRKLRSSFQVVLAELRDAE